MTAVPASRNCRAEIVGFEDQVAGALDGAEKGDGLQFKQLQVTKNKDIFRGPVFEKLIEDLRVFVVGLTDAKERHHDRLAV